jgi:hypothetical protein
MKSSRPIGNIPRLWLAVAILAMAPAIAQAQTQTQKPKPPITSRPATTTSTATAAKTAKAAAAARSSGASRPTTTTSTAPSTWKSIFHKSGSTPKTASNTKTVSKSKSAAASTPKTHAKTASNFKPAPAAKTAAASKSVTTATPAPRTTTASKSVPTAKPAATSRASAEPHSAATGGGLISTKSGGRDAGEGKGAGLLGGSRDAKTSANRSAKTAETRTPERTASEAKAPERTAAETKSPARTASEAKAPEAKTPEAKGAEAKTPEVKAPEAHAVENHAEPARTVTRPNGDRAEFNSAGKPTRLTTKSGDEASFDSRGQVRAIHTQDTTIRLGPAGGRTIVTERPDHTRIVSMGAHNGYVDHPVMRNGQPYLERTYVSGGHVYARAYPGYYYHGALYYRYLPPVYYAPAFYVWAVRPWRAPIAFTWNWGPWRAYYGPYFTPYPAYVDCTAWLTDYAIAQELKAAYESQQAANKSQAAPAAPPVSQPIPATSEENSGGAPLSPEAKQAIAEEVRAQLGAEQNSAKNSTIPNALTPMSGTAPPDALSPADRTFIADISLDAAAPSGAECSVTPGDVITRVGNTPDQDQKVKVVVRSSQNGDCAAGTSVAVSVSDLQDMANRFHEKVDDGVGQLAQSRDPNGLNGLPPAPPANPEQVADAQAKPDLDAQHQLQDQQHAADQAQRNVEQSVSELGATTSRIVSGAPSAALRIEDGGDAGAPRFAKSRARVSLVVNVHQLSNRSVCVLLRGRKRLMAEQLLDRAQVRTVGQKMSGESVA